MAAQSRSAFGITDVMKLYGIWDLLEPQTRLTQPGPAFWREAGSAFPDHTAYTKLRELIPTFRDLDRLEYKMLENIHKLSQYRFYNNNLEERRWWPERFCFSKEELVEELADRRLEDEARLGRVERDRLEEVG